MDGLSPVQLVALEEGAPPATGGAAAASAAAPAPAPATMVPRRVLHVGTRLPELTYDDIGQQVGSSDPKALHYPPAASLRSSVRLVFGAATVRRWPALPSLAGPTRHGPGRQVGARLPDLSEADFEDILKEATNRERSRSESATERLRARATEARHAYDERRRQAQLV